MANPTNGFDTGTILSLVQPPEPGPFDDVLSSIKEKYPAVAPYDWSLVDGREKTGTQGHLEFYSPEESESPTPGKPTIELFDKSLQGPELEKAIFGDMLHHLPAVDQKWAGMRDQFAKTLTPEQLAVDQQAYAREKDGRPFEDWMKQSRLDAYLRGYLTPDKADEWKGVYGPEQIKILEQMREHLEGGKDNKLRRNFMAQIGQEKVDAANKPKAEKKKDDWPDELIPKSSGIKPGGKMEDFLGFLMRNTAQQ